MRYSDAQMKPVLPPPTLGQHTDEILTQMLKLSYTEIKSLRDKNVIE